MASSRSNVWIWTSLCIKNCLLVFPLILCPGFYCFAFRLACFKHWFIGGDKMNSVVMWIGKRGLWLCYICMFNIAITFVYVVGTSVCRQMWYFLTAPEHTIRESGEVLPWPSPDWGYLNHLWHHGSFFVSSWWVPHVLCWDSEGFVKPRLSALVNCGCCRSPAPLFRYGSCSTANHKSYGLEVSWYWLATCFIIL